MNLVRGLSYDEVTGGKFLDLGGDNQGVGIQAGWRAGTNYYMYLGRL